MRGGTTSNGMPVPSRRRESRSITWSTVVVVSPLPGAMNAGVGPTVPDVTVLPVCRGVVAPGVRGWVPVVTSGNVTCGNVTCGNVTCGKVTCGDVTSGTS